MATAQQGTEMNSTRVAWLTIKENLIYYIDLNVKK